MLDWIPWWAYGATGLGLVFVVWRLLGTKAALAALAGVAGLVVYRKGRDEGAVAERRKELENAKRTVERARGARAGANTDRMHDDGFRRD